jgi:AcrR family transcriptional regulator
MLSPVPKLWTDTIQEHRREVREAILDTAAALVADHGLLSVTMSRIAEQAGIGRATLYKYFPDVEAILLTWHEREIARHLSALDEIRDAPGAADDRLSAVLKTYAQIRHGTRSHHQADVATVLHRTEGLSTATRQLHRVLRDLIAEAAADGDMRSDVAAADLATYCIHALSGAAELPTRKAVHQLVTVTLAGLRATAG